MPSQKRLESIDQFRGFAILLMVLANYLAGVKSIPAWLKHAPDIGLTVVDLIAPFFIFAVGLTFSMSMQRRLASTGWGKTLEHFVRRYMALIGIGCILSAGEIAFAIDQKPANWGVLQAIGVAGLVTLLVIRLPAVWRWIIGLALLAGYQYLLDHFWVQTVLHLPHGGLQGSISWAAMLILATAMADLFHTSPFGRKRAFYIAVILTLLAGIILAVFVPISKNRVSASYVLVSLGASGVVFMGFHWLCDRWHFRLPMLAAWGRNSLLLYFLHDVLLGIVVLPAIPAWYIDARLWLVSLQACALVAALSLIAWRLHCKNWVFAL